MILFNYTTSRDNNFKLIAFCCALTVLFSHSFPVSGGSANILYFVPEVGMTYGSIAVDVFFIISGFFITRGFLARKSVWYFLRSRFLRIYPGMLVATLFCVFVVGVIFTSVDLMAYFYDEQTFKFIKRNTLLYSKVKFYLPGVFQTNPYSPAVVGAVWTLPYQLKAYATLVLIVLVFQYTLGSIERGLARFVFISLALCLILFNIIDRAFGIWGFDNMRLYAMFYSGSCYFLIQDYVKLSYQGVVLVLVALTIGYFVSTGLFYCIYALGLGYILLCLAYLPKGRIRAFNKNGDYSYGIYIYGFTIQQSIMALAGALSALQLFAYAAICTLFMAYLSWHLIEKQALKLKPGKRG